MEEMIVVIDVGGTTITAAASSLDSKLISKPMTYPSKSQENPQVILNHFVTIIHDVFKSIKGHSQKCVGISIGFPGPFDYVRGISQMKNIDKFDALYDFPFKESLLKALESKPFPNQDGGMPILFANDATLFALGEYQKLAPTGVKKLMSITLGTGCGSTFIDSGKVVCGKCGIPEDGMIYHKKYRDSIIDDYLSKRGILRIASRYGYRNPSTEILEIYKDALTEDSKALSVFFNFGYVLQHALDATIEEFEPDAIVFGGQISKAYTFFGQQFSAYTQHKKIKVILSPDSVHSALIGASRFFVNR